MQTFWPKKVESWAVNGNESNESKRRDVQHFKVALTIKGSYWEYDGCFQKSSSNFNVELATVVGHPQPIQNLPIYPLKYADEGALPRLMERGRKFWEYRHMKYVSYTGWDFNRAEHFVSPKSNTAYTLF